MTERFSASQAGRHMACHASANLELAIPYWKPPVQDPNKKNAANKGTAMHKILEDSAEYTPKEMEGVARAMLYVAELRQTRRFKIETEATAEAWWTDTKSDTTADVVLSTQDQLDIVDYKMGKIPVEVVENVQGLFYAATFLPRAPKAKGVTFHIVQPFADNITSWWISADRLDQFMTEAVNHERKIQLGDTTFGPSDYCTFCPANPHTRGEKGKPLCPAMMELLYPSAGVDMEEMLNG